ncbi:MAG: hypothetical protein A3H45_15020 [Ignavibacteria bacterium RIFCSPLOWO2_02_FULL_55_14]|nr:MAG: hypothetical protein A3H45_15020 [Ignavibacteria bacterium RIFCSPLOWO2_02_FULL_55_14]
MLSGARSTGHKLPFFRIGSPSPLHYLSSVVPVLSSVPQEYQRRKLLIGLFSGALGTVLLSWAVGSGLTRSIEIWLHAWTNEPLVLALGVIAALSVGLAFVSWPLRWYSGFVLEHAYGLSNQSFGRWLWESLKGSLISLPLGVVVFVLLYYSLLWYGSQWWMPMGSMLFLLGVVLSRLAPVFILPLFYRQTPLEDERLRSRIMDLCARAGIHSNGVHVIDLSKNTKKANAAFTGIGKSRRILIGDTLIQNLTDDEIAAVVAHEIGHSRLHHIWYGMAMGTAFTFAGLFVAGRFYELALGRLGDTGLTDPALLPLLGVCVGVVMFMLGPAGHAYSRVQERAADRFAVGLIGSSDPLIRALRKLGIINLADPEPHPLVEALTYSHPSLGRRIRLLEAMTART